MKKYFLVMLFILAVTVLNACTADLENEDIQIASLQDIDTIQIEHGSIKLNIVSADIDDVEAHLLLNDNGPGIVLDKENRITRIRVKKDITRLAKINRMPQLEVQIPTEFKGKIIVNGSSGSVVGKELQTHNLRVNGSSGNVKLDFLHFHSEVYVTTTSGNVDVSLNGDEPDAELLLKSNSGRRSVAFVLDNHQQGKKETKGTSGSGDHKVQLETSSGSISLK